MCFGRFGHTSSHRTHSPPHSLFNTTANSTVSPASSSSCTCSSLGSALPKARHHRGRSEGLRYAMHCKREAHWHDKSNLAQDASSRLRSSSLFILCSIEVQSLLSTALTLLRSGGGRWQAGSAGTRFLLVASGRLRC